MQIIPLASSSKGNAYLVEHGGFVVLIDCGLSYRELNKRAKGALAQVGAVLITHNHSVHVQGLEVFLKHHDVPVFANVMTAEAVIGAMKISEEAFVCFENGQEFAVGPFTVKAFSIPHDASDPVGYLLKAKSDEGEEVYFHGTDIGTPLDSIGMQLKEATYATLESNHDPILLKASGRAPQLIQRIAGPRGHLSNYQAAELVKKFAAPGLRQLFLAHLSQDCNAPHLAEKEISAALRERGLDRISPRVLAP